MTKKECIESIDTKVILLSSMEKRFGDWLVSSQIKKKLRKAKKCFYKSLVKHGGGYKGCLNREWMGNNSYNKQKEVSRTIFKVVYQGIKKNIVRYIPQ